ncbi:MAG: amidohydrolase family protein [Pseudomonadota bacterium]
MSALDLCVRNALVPAIDDTPIDIGVAGKSIVTIGKGLPEAASEFDAEGRIALPGFVETHIHLDKSCILDRCSSKRGNLEEAIAEVARLKSGFTEQDVAERASRTLRKCIVNGTTKMRTHVEVDPVVGMRGYEGVKAAIADFAWAIDVEICVFPQEGLLNNPGTDELLVAGLKDGARVVGAAPYTDSDPHGQIDRIFELAREFDVDIDMHLDFGPDAGQLDLEHVCRRADEFGWGGRVAIGHVTKLAQADPARLEHAARMMADSGVALTVLPATDLFLMHRDHAQAVPRGVTPVHRLLAHGVNCSLSTNNVLNPFTPFGDCSLVRMANLYANIGQVGARESTVECLNMVSARSARLMNQAEYGIAVGNTADIVVIDAKDEAMAVAELAQPIVGFKAGRQSFSHALPELNEPS